MQNIHSNWHVKIFFFLVYCSRSIVAKCVARWQSNTTPPCVYVCSTRRDMQLGDKKKTRDSRRFRQEQLVLFHCPLPFCLWSESRNSFAGEVHDVAFWDRRNGWQLISIILPFFFTSMTFWSRSDPVMFPHLQTDHWSIMKTSVK